MAIQNVGTLQDILQNHKTKDWLKSANVNEANEFAWADDLKMPEAKGASGSFGDFLAKSIGDVNGLQKEANVAIQKLASGENKNLADTMLIVEKAEIAFKQMNQVRQKVIDAYREVMRIQV
jgi:flagellar hook-basal body complex protein FliE